MNHMLPKMLLLIAAAGLLAGCPSYGPHSLLNSASLDRAVAVRSLRARAGKREAYASAGVWGGSRSSTRLVGPPIYSGQTYYGALGIVSAPASYGSYSSGSSYRRSSGYTYYSSGDSYYSGGHAVGGAGASYGRYFPTYSSGSTYLYGPGNIGVWNGQVFGTRPVHPGGGRGRSGHGVHGRPRPGHPGTRPGHGHRGSGVTVHYSRPGLQIRASTGSR